MAPKISTREFRRDDYDAAVALWREVEGIEIAEGDSREEVGAFLLRNMGLSRVAEAGGSIVAAVLCGHDGRRGHIYHLAVSPAHQRRGLGDRLVQECLAGLRSAGITRAIVMVAEDNKCARSFWTRCGWEEIGGALAFGIDL